MKVEQSTKFQTKDFIVIGILSAVFFAMFLVISGLTAMGGPVVHIFSPVVVGIVGGIIYLLMITKAPKNWVLTLSSITVMILFQLIGNSYLPWVIGIILTSIIADLICIPSRYKSFKAITLGYSIMMVGQALGNVLPVVFFSEKFRKDFLSRGVDPSFMDPMINFIKGPMALVILLVSFISGIVGMLLAKKLLNKHFRKAGLI